MTNISQACILTVLIKPIQLFDLLLGFVKEKLMKNTLKNNLLWIALLAAISAITIKIVTSCSKGFSWGRFVCFLKGADPVWIMLAVLCAFGFIYFEGLGLQCTCRFFGHGFPAGKGIIFSASDIFFSAITPSFIALFLMCIFNEKLILKVCRWGLRLLCKIHVYKDYDAQYEKLLAMIKQYKECGALLKKETGLLIKVFLCNLAQRLSVIFVSVCVFLAVGGEAKCISFYATIVFCGVLLLCVLIKRKLKNGDKI